MILNYISCILKCIHLYLLLLQDSIEMNWNLMEYLPTPVRDQFTGAVAGFISTCYTQSDEIWSLLRGEISQKLFELVLIYICTFI